MDLINLGYNIIDLIKNKNIEWADDFKIDGIEYTIEEVYDDEWKDEGKYQYSYKVYRVGIADEDRHYTIKKPLDLFLRQDCIRSGSYFSDYYYEYEEPYMVREEEKIIVKKIWISID